MSAEQTNLCSFVGSRLVLDGPITSPTHPNTALRKFLEQNLEKEKSNLLAEIKKLNAQIQIVQPSLLVDLLQQIKITDPSITKRDENDLPITLENLDTHIQKMSDDILGLEKLIQEQDAKINETTIKLIAYGIIAGAIIGFAFFPWLAPLWITIIVLAGLVDLARRIVTTPWCQEKLGQFKELIQHNFFEWLTSKLQGLAETLKQLPSAITRFFSEFPEKFNEWRQNGIKQYIDLLGLGKGLFRLIKQIPKYLFSLLTISEHAKQVLLSIPYVDYIINFGITVLDVIKTCSDPQTLQDKLIELGFSLFFILCKTLRFLGTVLPSLLPIILVKVAGAVGLGVASMRSSFTLAKSIAEKQNNQDLLEDKSLLLTKIKALKEIQDTLNSIKKHTHEPDDFQKPVIIPVIKEENEISCEETKPEFAPIFSKHGFFKIRLPEVITPDFSMDSMAPSAAAA